MVQLFQTVLLEKVEVLKSAIWNWVLFIYLFFLSSMFGKNYQKMLFDKVEWLANTYKSSGLSCKLPKKTRYI